MLETFRVSSVHFLSSFKCAAHALVRRYRFYAQLFLSSQDKHLVHVRSASALKR